MYKVELRRIAILISVLIPFGVVHAAPVGNTSAPELIQKGLVISSDSWIDFRAGYEGDFVADGRMKQYEQGFGRLDNYQQWTNSGTATLNILDRLDGYAVFGSSRTEADWRFNDASTETVTRMELKTEYCFLWAAGARAILYEWGNASLGLGGRYSSCNYIPSWLASNGIVQPVNGSQFFWKEWQINFDASYKIHLFTPYIGIKYLNARTQLKDFLVPISASLNGSNSFQNRIPVGLYLGCTLSNLHYFMLNVEGRLVDEEAITISADFRF